MHICVAIRISHRSKLVTNNLNILIRDTAAVAAAVLLLLLSKSMYTPERASHRCAYNDVTYDIIITFRGQPLRCVLRVRCNVSSCRFWCRRAKSLRTRAIFAYALFLFCRFSSNSSSRSSSPRAFSPIVYRFVCAGKCPAGST